MGPFSHSASSTYRLTSGTYRSWPEARLGEGLEHGRYASHDMAGGRPRRAPRSDPSAAFAPMARTVCAAASARKVPQGTRASADSSFVHRCRLLARSDGFGLKDRRLRARRPERGAESGAESWHLTDTARMNRVADRSIV